MFKKIIAAALAALTLTVAGGTTMIVSAKESYKPIVTSKQNYHYCKINGCTHKYNGKYLSLNPSGVWGFVYSNASDHKDSYKYISISPYSYDSYHKEFVSLFSYATRKGGTSEVIVCPNAIINGLVVKVVYNGQIFRSAAKNSGILEKYLVGSFRSGVPIST
ncbi:hypothetical protein [Candidatus Pseudoruminococcus sp.]|uniref:hypothetical protein n=1 Tax=Candidatus Pseudoruminococcus sp. TaxID=3101048 RepID=UPI00399B9EE3